MTTSEAINELATALAKAQAEMGHAVKDSQNPHFKSSYADLASVRDAVRPLSKHGLSVVQSCRSAYVEGQWVAEVETRLLHTSGQWMADALVLPVSKPDAQGIGSAITYARRYTLAAFCGIAPEDDDGNAASAPHAAAPVRVTVPAGFPEWWDDICATADNGAEALKAAWSASPKVMREHATATKRADLDRLKVRAANAVAVTA